MIQEIEKNEALRSAAVEAASRHEASIYAKTYNETVVAPNRTSLGDCSDKM